MALSDILQKIAADYNERAQKIIDTALLEAEEFVRKTEEDERKKNEERWERAVVHKNNALRKTNTKSDIFGRQKVLSKKRSLIAEAFDVARTKLVKISSDEYADFLVPMIKEISIENGEIVSAKGRLNDTRRAVNKAKKIFKVVEGDFDGGFVFCADNIEINATFERLFEDLYRQYESEIARILFN